MFNKFEDLKDHLVMVMTNESPDFNDECKRIKKSKTPEELVKVLKKDIGTKWPDVMCWLIEAVCEDLYSLWGREVPLERRH